MSLTTISSVAGAGQLPEQTLLAGLGQHCSEYIMVDKPGEVVDTEGVGSLVMTHDLVSFRSRRRCIGRLAYVPSPIFGTNTLRIAHLERVVFHVIVQSAVRHRVGMIVVRAPEYGSVEPLLFPLQRQVLGAIGDLSSEDRLNARQALGLKGAIEEGKRDHEGNRT